MGWLADVGKEVRATRTAQGLTQAALAARAGVSRSTVARLETGRLPELGTAALRRLLQGVGLDLRVVADNRGRPTLDDLAAEQAPERPA